MSIIFDDQKLGEMIPLKKLIDKDGSFWGYRWGYTNGDEYFADVPKSDFINYYVNDYPIYVRSIKDEELPEENIAPIKGYLPILDIAGIIQYVKVKDTAKHIELFKNSMNLFYETNFFDVFLGTNIQNVTVFSTGIVLLIKGTSEKFGRVSSEIEDWLNNMGVSNFKFKVLGNETMHKYTISLTFYYNTVFNQLFKATRKYIAKGREFKENEDRGGREFNYGAFKGSNSEVFYCFPKSSKCSRVSVEEKIPVVSFKSTFNNLCKDYILNDKGTGLVEVYISKKIPFEVNHAQPLIPVFQDIITECTLLSEIRKSSQSEFENIIKFPRIKSSGMHQYKMSVNLDVDYSLLPFDISQIKNEVMNEFNMLTDSKDFYQLEYIYPVKGVSSEISFNENSICFSLKVETVESKKK